MEACSEYARTAAKTKKTVHIPVYINDYQNLSEDRKMSPYMRAVLSHLFCHQDKGHDNRQLDWPGHFPIISL